MNLESWFCTDAVPRAPLLIHSSQGLSTWRRILAHHLHLSQRALQCNAAERVKAFPHAVYKLNNSTPCPGPPRCPATHTHAYNDLDIVHFPPIMLGPHKGRAQCWTTSRLLSGKAMFGQCAGQGSGDVWPALCSVRLPTKREREREKKNAGPQVAVKTKTCFV